jgi:hypothetical protein
MICAPTLTNSYGGLATSTGPELAGRIFDFPGCLGLVIVVQSKGTDRIGRFERGVIEGLRWAKIGACYVDLATPERTYSGTTAPSIELMADRLTGVIDYLAVASPTWHLPLGLLASGVDAAAGLAAASRRSSKLTTFVSCFGRPDLAPTKLSELAVPTLLVAPARNPRLLQASEEAFAQLRCTSQLAIVRDAGEEPFEPWASIACEHAVRQWCHRLFRRRRPRHLAAQARQRSMAETA